MIGNKSWYVQLYSMKYLPYTHIHHILQLCPHCMEGFCTRNPKQLGPIFASEPAEPCCQRTCRADSSGTATLAMFSSETFATAAFGTLPSAFWKTINTNINIYSLQSIYIYITDYYWLSDNNICVFQTCQVHSGYTIRVFILVSTVFISFEQQKFDLEKSWNMQRYIEI